MPGQYIARSTRPRLCPRSMIPQLINIKRLNHAVLATAAVGTIHDRFIDINIAVSDLQIETAIGIGTYPGLILDGRSLAAEIREWYKVPSMALNAFRKSRLFHRTASQPFYFSPGLPA